LFVSVIAIIGWHDLARPGYTADEEFTEFAIRGIAATGLPLLPSGLLYDRGLAYSYAAWLTRAFIGDGLAPARALSFVCALLALVALWLAVRRISGHTGAWLAVLLVAASIPFWVVATTARFYAPFLASYLGALAVLASLGRTRPIASGVLLFALAAGCRWTHELAFTLAVVPAISATLAAKGERTRWMHATLAIVAGLVTAQAGIFALHFLAPQSGGTMIRRFFLWQVLNLFERPPLAAPLGVVFIAGLVTIVIRPTLLKRLEMEGTPLGVPRNLGNRIGLALALIVLAWAVLTGFRGAFDYPLDLFTYLTRTMPALTLAVLGLLVARRCGLGGAWTPGERAVHLLWLGWVVFFGVIDSGITINYLLAPVTLMLTAVAIDLAALIRHQQREQRAPIVALAVLIASAVAISSWGVAPRSRFANARPTVVAPDPVWLRQAASDAQMVACTDELACLLLVGRVDRWLALDDFLRERFVVSKPTGSVGVYAGAPVAYRLGDLFTPTASTPPPTHVLVIDVFKNLPVGNSSTFLPRALAREGRQASMRLETAQLRVVELRSTSGQ
jgi:hypothetical protein